MHLTIVGDSLGMPRLAATKAVAAVRYEQTYPERIRRHLLEAGVADVMLVNLCRHAHTSEHLQRGLASDILLSEPHALIIQLGIADLWPARGRNVPAPFPDMADKDPWVDTDAFARNLDAILEFCTHLPSGPPRVALVNIWPVSARQYARFPSVRNRIPHYNEILAAKAAQHNAALVDAYALARESGPGVLGDDGVHWTPTALDALARQLTDTLLQAGRASGQ